MRLVQRCQSLPFRGAFTSLAQYIKLFYLKKRKPEEAFSNLPLYRVNPSILGSSSYSFNSTNHAISIRPGLCTSAEFPPGIGVAAQGVPPDTHLQGKGLHIRTVHFGNHYDISAVGDSETPKSLLQIHGNAGLDA